MYKPIARLRVSLTGLSYCIAVVHERSARGVSTKPGRWCDYLRFKAEYTVVKSTN